MKRLFVIFVVAFSVIVYAENIFAKDILNGLRIRGGVISFLMEDVGRGNDGEIVAFSLGARKAILNNAELYIEFNGGQGFSPTPTFAGMIDESPETAAGVIILNKAYVEYDMGFLNVVFGKISASDYFDTNNFANDGKIQFFNANFVNNPLVEWPDNGFGFVLSFRPISMFYVSFGLEEADSDWQDAFDKPFMIFEVGVKPKTEFFDGNYRFFLWYNGEDHYDMEILEDIVEGTRPFSDYDRYKRAWGIGISADQTFFERFGAFFRFGLRSASAVLGDLELVGPAGPLNVNDINQAVNVFASAGFTLVKGFLYRDYDEFGVGISALFVKDYKDFYNAIGVDIANEYTIEVYHRFSFNGYAFQLTPDFQIVINPNCLENEDTAVVFGLRALVVF